MDVLMIFGVMLVFLLLKGFFSGSEIAMVSCDKLKMRHAAKTGDRGAALVLKLFKKPDVILGTTLVGTNIATVTISTMAALLFIDWMGPSGDFISVLVFTPILLILGEIVPKSVYQQNADTIAKYIIYGLRFFSLIFFPVIIIFSFVARTATRLVGGSTGQQGMFITREEIRMLLEMSESASNVDQFNKHRIRRIIRFADTTVGEAMIPLAEVVGIQEEAAMEDGIDLIWNHGYNRLPVYHGNLTNVVGVLTLNTFELMEEGLEKKPISAHTKTPLYISPKQTIDNVLPAIQAREDHMAVVVDEFGSAVGILTMEDIFEEVVGEIDVGADFDEYHPRRKVVIEQEGDDAYVVDGRTPLNQINDMLHLHIPVGDAHTVAGMILNKLKAIPEPGAEVEEEGFKFTVKESDARSILKVHIERSG